MKRNRWLVMLCICINFLTAMMFLISAVIRVTHRIDGVALVLLLGAFVTILFAMRNYARLK